jgi:hypothetical protein
MATLDTRGERESDIHEDAAFYASRRAKLWPRRVVSPGLRFLLWSLRVYVVFMLVVVAIELSRILK